MRVHVSVQIISQNVLKMLKIYCEGNKERVNEYDSLIFMIEKFDTLINIWNPPLDRKFKRDVNKKRCEYINSCKHEYI